MTNQYKRLTVIFLLGFASGLPFALLSGTLQAWYVDSGLTVTQVGFLSLLGLPYAYRVLFAPLADRFQLARLGKRRAWMLLTQTLLLCGFNILACLNPHTSLMVIGLFALVLSMCSAMQDVVVDAQRIEYLPEAAHGLGASYGMLGYHIAVLAGGGGSLILAQHFGWPMTYRIMGFSMVLGLFATLWSEEPQGVKDNEKGMFLWKAPFKALLEKPHWISLCLFIFCYKLGDAFTSTSSGIVMPFLKQALDFANETIGYVYKGIGIFAWIFGALIAGYGLRRWSLYKTLLYCGILSAFSTLLWYALAFVGKNLSLFVGAVFVGSVISGLTTTALVTFLMRMTDKRYTATQFALLVAIGVLPRCISGPVGAWIQSHIGWVGLYESVFLMSFLFIPFLYTMRDTCKDEVYSVNVA